MDDLSLRSRFLLDIIGETDDEPLRVSDLIRQVQAGTAPTIYSGLAELEKGGWITRDNDPRDGRSYRLRLTQRSRRAYTRMSRDIARLMEE